jgi:hypothetical protein
VFRRRWRRRRLEHDGFDGANCNDIGAHRRRATDDEHNRSAVTLHNYDDDAAPDDHASGRAAH